MKFLSDILAKAGLVVDGVTQLNTVANATTDTDKFLVSDGGVVKYRTGAELASDIGPGNLSVSTVKHLVKLGVAASKGQAVYVSSADGTNMIVSKASNAAEPTSSKTLGLLETGGVLNDQVYVVTEGLLAGLDTSTANAGDPVWLGTDGNILFGLLNKPYAPAHLVFIGIVTRAQQNNGEIFVKVQNGFEVSELHDVQITTTPANNSVLSYETSSSLYKMKSIATLLGYTPANAARNITINGVTYDLSADRSWSIVAGVSSVSAGTGISVNTTTGAITVTNTGLISATAGSGISVTTSSGNLNIVNTGLLSGLAGSGISVTTSSGALTITNTGLLSALAGSGISVSTSSGTVTINNTGLLSGLAGAGISVTTSSGALTITNTGILSALAGTGISVSTSNGTLTITNTITNNNQLTNGAGYLTSYTETDTLASVTGRGSSTSQTLFVDQTTGGGYVFRTSSAWGGWARHGFSMADGSNNILSALGGYGGSGTSISYMYIGKSYADFSAAFNPDGNVEFRYDNSTRLTVDSSGISVSGRITSGWGQFSSSTQGTPIVKAIQEDSASGYYLFQGVTGSTEVFRVDRLGGGYFSGSVGIGTVNPTKTLHVYTSGNEGIYLQGTGGGVWMNIQSAAGNLWSIGAQNDGMGVYNRTSSLYAFFIKDNRQVQFSGYTGSSSFTGTAAGYLAFDSSGNILTVASVAATDSTKLALAGGTMTGKILTPSSADGTYGGAIEIRERGYVSNSQSDWSYSPAITFHWGNRAALRFGLRSDGLMAVDQNPIVIQNGGTWSINVTGTANSETLSTVTGRGASTSSQVSFTKTDDHAISVGTIRGRAVGSQTGEFIQLYERVNIGGPSGWGAANTAAPTYGLSVYGGANIGYGNSASLFAYSYRGNSNVGGTGEASYHPAGVYSTGTNWLYGTMYLNNNTIHDASNIYNSGWYRNYNQTGLYNQTYDNHFASYESNYWRLASGYGLEVWSKGFGAVRGYLYTDGGSFGLLNSSGQWAVRTYGGSETQLMYNGSWRGIAQSNGFRVNGNLYTDVDYGYGLVGVYTSTRYQGVFAMGDAYKLPADGTSTGSLYGLAWSHPNAGGIAGNLNDHGLLVLINGGFAAAVSSSIRAASDMRAPIFYDQNDTGYYLDLNSTSNSAMRIRGGALFGPNPTWGAYLSVGTNGHASASYASVAATNGNLHLDGASGCHMYLNYYVNGIIYLNGSTYSISSNGSYYNGTSSYSNNSGALNGWGYGSYAYRSSGSGYYQIDTWLQMNGTHGIYWPSYYGAHLYVNTGSSYTQFRLDGQKNGYGGIWDSYSAVAGIMYDGGGNGGVYREANGRWYWYHHVGNNCTAINTSTTSSSYRAYIGGSLYAEGDVVAYSDVRKKTDITTIDNALEKVNKLRGVFYTRIDAPERGRQTGVIAQEINQVLPEVVTYAADVDEYGVSYGNITGVLIEAIKEQQKQIEELQNKLDNVLSSR